MGRTPCCGDHQGQRRGPWTPEEDQKLINYLQRHGLSNWRTLPKLAGLSRCGKSCRLRWTNYLRPDIKRGTFTIEEDLALIRLHAILGNKWSAIASHFPGRTDNEIKNRWNTKLKKQLLLMGIDPVTHRSLLPTPPYMHSFLASSSTVESTMAAGCNTALVESELRRLSRDDVNNISHVSPGSWNLLAMIKNTVETPVGACPSSEILLPLPYISMDQLLWPRTSRWPHGFHEALQLSNMERKSEGMANINSYGIPSNLKNEMDAFLDDLLSGEETEIMYDYSRHSEISASFENGIHYHTDRAAIPAARADLLNKVDEIDYSVNFLNTYDGMEELNQIIDARPA